MSYTGFSVGRIPPADRSNAKSRDSSGADSAEPKEVLCSSTCTHKIISLHACRTCQHNIMSSRTLILSLGASVSFGGAPGPQPHMLIAQPIAANHSAPARLQLCIWRVSFWRIFARFPCDRMTCSLDVTLHVESALPSRLASYA